MKKFSPCNCRPSQCKPPDFYAQYGVQAIPSSNTNLPLFPLFQKGNKIILNSDTEIILPTGYLYLIDFIFEATTEPNGYFQISPVINGSLLTLYSFFAPANSTERNSSASGSFTTNNAAEQNALLSFRLVYPDTVRNIDISGAISVTPLMLI